MCPNDCGDVGTCKIDCASNRHERTSNAVHTSFKVTQVLAKHGIAMQPHPPYSPNLSPKDFFIFPRLKSRLRGHRFVNLENLLKNLMRVLKSIPVEDFFVDINVCQNRWQRLINAEGGGLF